MSISNNTEINNRPVNTTAKEFIMRSCHLNIWLNGSAVGFQGVLKKAESSLLSLGFLPLGENT